MAVLEMARFSIDPTRVEEYLAARPAVEAAMRELPGLTDLRFARLDATTFIDLVTWVDHDAAMRALELAASDPRLAPQFELPQDVDMQHAEILGA